MKKKFLFFTVILSLVVLTSNFSYFKTDALNFKECDAIFINSIESILDKQGYASQQINASKEVLLDISLNELGVLYIFEIDNYNSYAIIIKQDDEYIMTECFLATENPYVDVIGSKVYVNISIYLQYIGDKFYLLDGQSSVSFEELEILKEVAYCGGTIVYTDETATINYTYKSSSAYKMASRYPQYMGLENLQNSCAVTAGGNIIGYYDRFCENLIPNYVPGVLAGNNYIYKGQGAEVESMITQLYYDMETTAAGTTLNQFQNGLTKYCNDRSRNITFTSCMSGSVINYNTVKNQISANQPVALFITKYNIASFTNSTNKDIVSSFLITSNHVMIGFGYLDITYTYSNNATQNYQYIEIASGLALRSTGYYNINYNSTINNAYAINIY